MLHESDHPDPNLPPELARRLEAMHSRPIPVPPEIDRAVLNDARRRMNRMRVFRLAARLGGAAAALAAMLLLAIRLFTPDAPAPMVASQAGPTMLDAYRLARLVDAGHPVDLRHDYNRDGRVDHADVDVLARAVVRLDGETR